MRRYGIALVVSLVFLFITLAGCTSAVVSTMISTPTRVVAPTMTLTPTRTLIPTEGWFRNVSSFPNPVDYQWKVVLTGLTNPLDMADAGDGRMFFVEKKGVIRLAVDGILQEIPFLDISNQVGSQGMEQGLLGLALEPNFISTGRFYVNYTDQDGNTNISRFTSPPGALQAAPGSEVQLLFITQPFENHNGGGLAFGPDDCLYIGVGDGGSHGDPQGNGQSLDTRLGKLLRIDVINREYYSIPPDNPDLKSEFPEIWVYGLRNPWRFSFDRASGDLYLADVGQDSFEEVNYLHWTVDGGVNFGWNFREGMHPFAETPPAGVTLMDPVWEYGHDQGCSITGGYVYRGKQLQDWEGIYLAGDYCSRKVWGLLRMPDGSWQTRLLFEDVGGRISSFGRDADGEIYLLRYDIGDILRLEHK